MGKKIDHRGSAIARATSLHGGLETGLGLTGLFEAGNYGWTWARTADNGFAMDLTVAEVRT